MRLDAAKHKHDLALRVHAIRLPSGNYYGHIALFPVLDFVTSTSSDKVSSNAPFAQLSDCLFDYFSTSPVKYEFKIQLGTSPSNRPTEDAA